MGRRDELIAEYWEKTSTTWSGEIDKEYKYKETKDTIKIVKERLTEIVGHGMEPERAEIMVDQILEVFNKYKKTL